MADSIANRDEAHKCTIIARRALANGDVAKAERFALKALQMHHSDEVEHLLVQIKVASSGPNGNVGQQPSNEPEEESEPSPGPRATPNANGRHTSQSTPSTSQRSGQPAGMRTSNLRARHAQGRHAEAPPAPDPGTPDQRKQVADILASNNLYEILGLPKTASDDDIRKAYRKDFQQLTGLVADLRQYASQQSLTGLDKRSHARRLALKLHPDKNCAHRADDAFKAVGKAFACLSDPDKRAYYDRTGFESSAAAAAAQTASRQGSGAAQRGPGGMYYTQDFDPDEIFNMFFGGMNPNARVFRAQFGGGGQRRQAPPPQQRESAAAAQDDVQRMIFNLFQFLPVVLLVLISMFAASQKSPFALVRDYNHYPDPMQTQRLDVPYFVKSSVDFERQYARGSATRFKLERQIESDYYDRQQQRCQTEKMSKHRMWAHGRREEANRMPMTGCDEVDRINHRLGVRNQYAWG